MKKNVKFILLGVVVLAVLVGIIYSITAPVVVPLTQIQPKVAELSFSEQGTVTADSVVQIYPLAQGELIKTNVTEGQNVRAGDILCVIDSAPLQIKISQINSEIQGYEAQLANLDTEQEKLRSDLLTSKNRLMGEMKALESQEKSSNTSLEDQLRLQNILIDQNQKDLDRATEEFSKAAALYSVGSISKTEYENAESAVTKCESALEASKQQQAVIASGAATGSADYYTGMKESLNAQIEGINQSLSKNYTTDMKEYYKAIIQGNEASIAQLKKDIVNCNVTANVDGVITKLYAKNTNFVSGAAPVAEITVPGGNFIEVYVSTNDVNSIKAGDTVNITLKRREGDIVFTGKITSVDTNAELRLSALGVEERKVKVEVSPDTESMGDVSLGIGYNVDVKFFIYNEENKFAVPKTALFKDNDKDMLWIVRNGKAEAKEVVKGLELRTETVIESGLKSGDYVVSDANNIALKNGVRVKGE